MPKMQNSGVIVTVPDNRVDFMLRAGYIVIDEEETPKAKVKPTQPEEWEPEELVPEAVKEVTPAKKHKKG